MQYFHICLIVCIGHSWDVEICFSVWGTAGSSRVVRVLIKSVLRDVRLPNILISLFISLVVFWAQFSTVSIVKGPKDDGYWSMGSEQTLHIFVLLVSLSPKDGISYNSVQMIFYQ